MLRLTRLFQQAGAERLSSLVGQTVAGRYLITGELGRGGMGVVYRAEDQKANHLPRALKVLLPFAPAETRSRFQDESRVLAQVVGIDGLCRVHEVGIVDCPPFQQEPFLVMDLIAGVELEVDGRSRHYLELRELLADRAAGRLPPAEVVRLLRRCAKALEAVHALRPAGRESPIVHRDLKPENILLSPSSDATMRFHVHIVDFGLAAESPLHMEAGEGGARIEGTPLYMAPEQLSGTGPVGPAADVWALGILLFQLTTGQLPFTCDVTSPGSAVERMRAAVRRTPAWELIEDVDLRQIGERCLTPAPQDRPSMSELVRSFDLWLQQLPQPAAPLSRRLELWARRNRGAAVALGAVAALLGVALIANGRLSAEKQATQRALAEAKKAREEVDDQAQLVLEVVDLLITAGQDQLEVMPGQRLSVLTQAMEKLEKVVRRQHNSTWLDVTSAIARTRRGQLALGSLHLGGAKQARTECEAAVASFRCLAQLKPQDANAWYRLGVALIMLGDAQLQLGDADAAGRSFEEARSVGERLRQTHPQFDNGWLLQAFALQRLGDRQSRQGDSQGGVKLLHDALEAARAYLVARPDDREGNQLLAEILDRTAGLQLNLAELDQAEQGSREGLEILQRLIRRFPSDYRLQLSLASAHRRLGSVFDQGGQKSSAQEQYEHVIRGLEVLHDRDARHLGIARELASAYLDSAIVLDDLGKREAAAQRFASATQLRREVHESDPANRDLQYDLAAAYLSEGNHYRELSHWDKTQQLVTLSLEILEKLHTSTPADDRVVRLIEKCQRWLGEAELHRGEIDAAVTRFRFSLDITRQLSERYPASIPDRHNVAVSHSFLADAHVKRKDLAAAREDAERAVEIGEEVIARDPKYTPVIRDLGVYYERLGSILRDQMERSAATQWFEKSYRQGEALTALDPRNVYGLGQMFLARLLLGMVAWDNKDTSQAREHFERALKIAETIRDLEPQQVRSWRNLASCYSGLVMCALAENRGAAVLAYIQAGRSVSSRIKELDELTELDRNRSQPGIECSPSPEKWEP